MENKEILKTLQSYVDRIEAADHLDLSIRTDRPPEHPHVKEGLTITLLINGGAD